MSPATIACGRQRQRSQPGDTGDPPPRLEERDDLLLPLWDDGNVLDSNDGLFRVPVEGAERGHVQQFLTVPVAAETCGPLITRDARSVFVAVQHPGEADGSTFESPASTWPHTHTCPRPAVAVAYKP